MITTRISVDLFDAARGDSIGVARLARSKREKNVLLKAAAAWGLNTRETPIPVDTRLFSVVISNDDGRFEDELRTTDEVVAILNSRLSSDEAAHFDGVLAGRSKTERLETDGTFAEVILEE